MKNWNQYTKQELIEIASKQSKKINVVENSNRVIIEKMRTDPILWAINEARQIDIEMPDGLVLRINKDKKHAFWFAKKPFDPVPQELHFSYGPEAGQIREAIQDYIVTMKKNQPTA